MPLEASRQGHSNIQETMKSTYPTVLRLWTVAWRLTDNSGRPLASCHLSSRKNSVAHEMVVPRQGVFDNRFRLDSWIDGVVYSGLEFEYNMFIYFSLRISPNSSNFLSNFLQELCSSFEEWVSLAILIPLYGMGQLVRQNPWQKWQITRNQLIHDRAPPTEYCHLALVLWVNLRILAPSNLHTLLERERRLGFMISTNTVSWQNIYIEIARRITGWKERQMKPVSPYGHSRANTSPSLQRTEMVYTKVPSEV